MKRIESTESLKADLKHAENIKHSEIINVLVNLGKGMADEQLKRCFESLDEAIESVGNTTKGGGVDGIFESLEKIHLDFDEEGKPAELTLVTGNEETKQKIKSWYTEIQSDPILLLKYNILMDKKREEWRDREASRNLAE